MLFNFLNKNIRLNYLVIIILCSALFFPFLGSVHLFDWDEINFAESAREMLITGNYSQVQINFQPFWEKPPLFFWMQAISMKVFGVNEFAARFPNAICGIVTMCFIFYIGKKYFDVKFGWIWVATYIGSFLPHFYFKSGIIDPWFNLFIFSAIFFIFLCGIENKISHQILYVISGIFTGLAILTKGPVALLIVVLTVLVFAFVKRNFNLLHPYKVSVYLLTIILTTSLWYGLEVYKNGLWFLREFITYQIRLFLTPDSGHSGPFYFHVVVILLGCFPASLFAFHSFFFRHPDGNIEQLLRLWMVILFFVVLILFSIVTTKIIHYSSLCYLPLTFLAAFEISFLLKQTKSIPKFFVFSVAFFGTLTGIALFALPYFGNNIELIMPYIKDPFAAANLMQPISWKKYLYFFGPVYVVLILTSCRFFLKQQQEKGITLLFCSTVVIIFFSMVFFVPQIEKYSQEPVIEFYESLQNEDVYVEVSGFKSYAHLFYTYKLPSENNNAYNKNWLLNGETDKPVYIVTKINKAEKFLKEHPQFQKLHQTGGYIVFVKR